MLCLYPILPYYAILVPCLKTLLLYYASPNPLPYTLLLPNATPNPCFKPLPPTYASLTYAFAYPLPLTLLLYYASLNPYLKSYSFLTLPLILALNLSLLPMLAYPIHLLIP